MLVTYIHNVEHRNLRIRKHVTTSCSGTKPFYYFWVKGFVIRREAQSYYSGFIIWPLSRAAPMARKFVSPQRAPKVEPPRSASSFNSLSFLQIPQILRALPVREVIHTLSSRFVSGYFDISEWHVRPPRARQHLHQACTYLSRKVVRLTKPKGMNRNPSAIILQYPASKPDLHSRAAVTVNTCITTLTHRCISMKLN